MVVQRSKVAFPTLGYGYYGTGKLLGTCTSLAKATADNGFHPSLLAEGLDIGNLFLTIIGEVVDSHYRFQSKALYVFYVFF